MATLVTLHHVHTVFGWQAEEVVDQARTDIADLINADPREIVFTSGCNRIKQPCN